MTAVGPRAGGGFFLVDRRSKTLFCQSVALEPQWALKGVLAKEL
jgi:hypothetical protein